MRLGTKMSKQKKRHRPHTAKAWLSEQELAQFLAQAERAETSLSALIRHAVLNQKPPRASRQPVANRQEIARLNATLCELTQALRDAASTSDQPAVSAQIAATRRGITYIRRACRQALGFRQ